MPAVSAMGWDADAAFAQLATALAARPVRSLELPPGGPVLRASAVLAPLRLSPEDGAPELLFTRRPEHLRHHAGQISFPGGAQDAGDGDAKATALRELQEELGLKPAEVTVLGPLDELPTPSGFRIAPFVGRITTGAALAPNPSEVDELIRLPLAELAAPGRPRVETRAVFGRTVEVYFYEVGAYVVWGATAHIVHALLLELGKLSRWSPFMAKAR